MNSIRKCINILVCMCLASLIILTKIQASEMKKLNVEVTSSLRYIDEDGNARGLYNVPFKAMLEMSIHVSSKQEISASISFDENEGINKMPYFYGVLVIDSHIASQNEYMNFIGEGIQTKLDEEGHTFVVKVAASGDGRGQTVSGNVIVKANELVSTNDKEYIIQTFHGSFLSKQNDEYIQISIYDQNDHIIEEFQQLKGTPLYYLGLNREGYVYLGLNMSKDGDSSSYYQGEVFSKDTKLYAIYKKKEYVVNYYINDTLYARRYVLYQQNAPYLLPNKESIQDGEFLGWDQSLEEITSDMNVYAKISPNLIENEDVRYELINRIDGVNIADSHLKESTIKNKNNEKNVNVIILDNISKNAFGWLGIVLLWLLIILFMLRQKHKAHKKSKIK